MITNYFRLFQMILICPTCPYARSPFAERRTTVIQRVDERTLTAEYFQVVNRNRVQYHTGYRIHCGANDLACVIRRYVSLETLLRQQLLV